MRCADYVDVLTELQRQFFYRLRVYRRRWMLCGFTREGGRIFKRRDVAALAVALALGVAACVVASGCGSVTAAADAGDGRAVDSMLSSELGPDHQVDDTLDSGASDAPAGDVVDDASPRVDGAAVGDRGASDVLTCSWDCRAFCDCGALPCCRATGAADCCTR